MKLEWKTCFRAGVTVVLVFLFIFYFSSVQEFLIKAFGTAIPLIAGGVIAYVINILMMFYERHYFPGSKKKFFAKTRRPVCMLLAALSLVGIIALVISLILPQLISCIQLLLSQIPGALEILINRLEKLGFVPQKIMSELVTIDWQARIGEIVETVSSYFGNMMSLLFNVITAVFSVAVGALLSIIFAFYLLVAKDRLLRQCNALIDSYLKPKASKKIRYIGKVMNESFHNYIVGQSTEAVILGLLCMLGMKILGLPYESMIGALVAFTALVPVVGAYVGAIVGAFIIAMVDPTKALVFIVFIIILQQIEGNLIYPRVVGSSIGLPGMWVLVAVTVGGGVFGVPGMLIGVPLTAGIYRIVRHDVRKKIAAFNAEKQVGQDENVGQAEGSVQSENTQMPDEDAEHKADFKG